MPDINVKELRTCFNDYISKGYSRYRAVQLTAAKYGISMSQTGSMLRNGAKKRQADTGQLSLFTNTEEVSNVRS